MRLGVVETAVVIIVVCILLAIIVAMNASGAPQTTGGARARRATKTSPAGHAKTPPAGHAKALPAGHAKTSPAGHAARRKHPAANISLAAATQPSGDNPEDADPETFVVVLISADSATDINKNKRNQIADAFMEHSYFQGIPIQPRGLSTGVSFGVFPRWYLRHPYAHIVVVAVGAFAGEVAYEMRSQGGDRIAGVVLVDPGPLVSPISPGIAAALSSPGAGKSVIDLASDHLARNVAVMRLLAPDEVKVYVSPDRAGDAEAFAGVVGRAAVTAAGWSNDAAVRVAESINDILKFAVKKNHFTEISD